MNRFDSEDITKEIGLLDVYKASRSRLKKNKINIFSTLAVFIMLTIYAFFSNESSVSLLEKLRNWAEMGFSFSAGILGFLIAGFAIFATVSDKKLFTTMARTEHKKSGLSYLKHNFFALMYVFIAYLGFAILCLLVQLLGGASGFISIMIELIASNRDFLIIKSFLAGIGIVVVGTWFFYSLMLLQTFIFNIYHIVMTSIRWEVDKDNPENN